MACKHSNSNDLCDKCLYESMERQFKKREAEDEKKKTQNDN